MVGSTSSRVHSQRLLQTMCCCAVLVAAGCGGGDSTNSLSGTSAGATPSVAESCNNPASCSQLVTTLTDTQGEFLSYIVSLTSLQLQTASGASVETLPATTQIDFAQLVDLGEVLGAGQVPAGNYVSATLTLNYSNAQITVAGSSGTPVSLQPVDANGNPLTGTVTVTVQLDNAHSLVITPGDVAELALDFNLAASNTVNLTTNTVQVVPTFAASIAFSNTLPVRVRGTFASANTAQSDFVVDVLPFYMQGSSSGQVTVQVNSTTTYEINGTAYSGSAGLAALAGVSSDTMVAAFGSFQTGTQTVTATTVLAGTSLQSATQDEISGTVVASSGSTLTVQDATWSRPGGGFQFEPSDVTVTIGSGTVVTEEGQTGTYSIEDISVGQHLDIFGTASQGSGGALSLDATTGAAMLDYTSAWGIVTNLASGSGITLDLQSLDGLEPSVFNFSGTGSSASSDASAASYEVSTGDLSQTGLAVNSPARVVGFVAPFGEAPPDFTAQTLVNYSAVTDDLLASWGYPGSTAAFTGLSATSDSLTLDLANVVQDFISIGPERLELTSLASTPTIVPATTAGVVFTIGHAGRFVADNSDTFSAFASQLATDLNGTTAVIAVAAAGQYDSSANTFTATRVTVVLSE